MAKALTLFGVILAGGRSSRMGQDKALLTVNNETMLSRTQQLLHSLGAKEVLVARNEPGCLNDIYPGGGPMAGIHSALVATKPKKNKVPVALLIVPIDMPLLDNNLLAELISCGKAMQCPLHFNEQQLPLFLPNTLDTRDYAELVASSKNDRSIKRFLNIIASAKINHNEQEKFLNTNNVEQWQQAVNVLTAQEM